MTFDEAERYLNSLASSLEDSDVTSELAEALNAIIAEIKRVDGKSGGTLSR